MTRSSGCWVRATLNRGRRVSARLLGRRSVDAAPGALLDPIEAERSADEYDDIWSHPGFLDRYLSEDRLQFYRELHDFVISHVDVTSMSSILDVGCGPGYLLKVLGDANPDARLAGFDLSPAVLKAASEVCPRASFDTHDVYNEIHQHFDLVFCTEVLEHLDYPRKALDRIVEAASQVVLTVPNGRLDSYRGHINFWSMRSWRIFLDPYAEDWDLDTRFLSSEKKIATFMRRRDGEPGATASPCVQAE